jgi:alkylhydroperoxidase family enzyme
MDVERRVEMQPYLSPIEKPKGLFMRIAYWMTRRIFGKVPTPLTVNSARMPSAFFRFSFKASRLDNKLKLPQTTAQLVREQVARTNGCLFCMDTQRWFVMKKAPDNLAKLDALPAYRTDPLFTEAERAALDYAAELTETRRVSPATFERLARFYSEREICDIVWLVSSEHLYNIANHGLNIGSDDLCALKPSKQSVTS